jgi:hypothetical protein
MICKEFYKTIGLKKPAPLNRSERVKFNRYVFDNFFIPRMSICESSNLTVTLNDDDLKFLENFSIKKTEAKTKECNGVDNNNRAKREMSGACIEYGILKFFGKEKEFDDSIVTSSYKRNHPDLLPLGIMCDIKGSSINNVPLVFKSTRTYACNFGKYKGRRFRCANIIGITNQKFVWILGIASPRVLEDYVDDNLIMMPEIKTKTGFYGVKQLINVPKNWSEFKEVCSKNSLIL